MAMLFADGQLLGAAALLAATAVGYALYCGYETRLVFRSLRTQGIPIMEHSMLLGHLGVIGGLLSQLPSDAHGDYMMMMILHNWQALFPDCSRCPPIAYIDLWPFAPPTAISLSAELSAQFTQDYSLPKAHQQKRTLHPLTLNRDLSSMEGAEWRLWRKRLNPGFSIQNITNRIPDIVDEVDDFVRYIDAKAGKHGQWGPVFALQDATIRLALDVILRFVLNVRLHQQTRGLCPMARALIDSISRLYFFVNVANFFLYVSPWRRFKLWANYRTMSSHLTPYLKQRTLEIQSDGQVTDKTLIDLIVKSIDEEKDGSDSATPPLVVDAAFVEMAVGQIVTFLFAGHDTTATTICWLLHTLSQHPEVLEKVRAEHNAVLGPDPAGAAAAVRRDPHLLNALVYTHAAVKESMRLHTNVGTMRRGEPGFFLVGPPESGPGFAGKQLPTDGFVVWDGTFAIHRDPRVWHRADEFIPERFTVTDETDALYPPRHAWRSFEIGARNCIGQHLAMVEIKLAAALVLRRYDVECAWAEWDRSRGIKKQPKVWGDRCYQVGADSPPRVKDGMPVRVRARTSE